MAGTKNSISSLLAQFLRLQQNSLEIITKLSSTTTSKQDTVSVDLVDENNQASTVSIPSWGYIINNLNRLDSNIKALSGLDNGNANVRNADGTLSRIYQFQPLVDPKAPSNLQVPSNFKYRNNYFFESFLNPLLFVTFSLDGQVPAGTKRVYIKRIIANTTTDAQKNYFDNNLKGKNDVSDLDFMTALSGQNITYFIDENPVELPLQVVRYTGSFSVLRVFDQTIPVTVAGQVINQKVRKYKLDSITYKDTIANSSNSDRQLKVGDMLMTALGSKFQITNIDLSELTVVLKRISGYDPVTIGAGSLILDSEILSPLVANVNIGHDERQGVFIKAINDDYHVTGSSYSNGAIFYSNEMLINTSGGSMTLDDFYKNQVADFGTQFLSNTKENVIPSVHGLTPNTPVLNAANFQVIQINKQVSATTTAQKFSNTVQTKVKLQSEIDSLNSSINQSRSQLASLTTTSVTQSATSTRESLLSKIDSLTKEKATKTALLQTVIQDLNNISSSAPEITGNPVYRVRGFWPIPSPVVDSKTGSQEVIQFRVRYRYLSKQGNAPQNDQLKYTDNDGTQKTGTYSNWNEYKTDIRKKAYNTTTMKYYWLTEDITNGDLPNINQLDITINPGEQLEIKVASISEAGWPINPLESDFSPSVIISFPNELSTTNQNDQYVQQNKNDQVLVQLQQNLTSIGLDTHLETSFNSGDKYYAHVSEVISSGFYNSNGKLLNLFEKLTAMDQTIASLQALISAAKGVLSVYIISGSDSISVKRGSVIQLFAGYYNELLDLTNSNNYGKIVTSHYSIQLVNETASPLELASLIPGGQSVLAASTGSDDYMNNRKYNLTPISVTSIQNSDVIAGLIGPAAFKQTPPWQSGNTNSQFIYPRYKSVGFDNDLYFTPLKNLTWDVASGVTGSNGQVPLNGSALIPFDPIATAVGSTTDPNVWNGIYTGGVPSGQGKLNEFCIHVSHPTLVTEATTTQKQFNDLYNPKEILGASFVYPSFRHSAGFELSTTDSPDSKISYQKYPFQQLEYNSVSTASYNNTPADNTAYPDKLGFDLNDEYLIGKYSCGSYLYLSPANYSSIQVEGSTSLAGKALIPGSQNAIVVPVIFQMRCQDKLGYVGGYRTSGNVRNITYSKRIGIDIKVSNEELFSFDLIVSGSYTKTALVSPTYSSYKDVLGSGVTQ
jgi:hypothetical protein